jgi:hypothetical protein
MAVKKGAQMRDRLAPYIWFAVWTSIVAACAPQQEAPAPAANRADQVLEQQKPNIAPQIQSVPVQGAQSEAPAPQPGARATPVGAAGGQPLKSPSDGQPQNSNVASPVSIVRYIGWDAAGWQPKPSGQNIADYYTQLEVYSQADIGGGAALDSTNLRSYDNENRTWLERLFESETDTVTTLTNVEVSNSSSDLKFSVPLFSITHASGRDLGNTWVTNYTQSYIESPLFLVGSDAKIVVHLKAEVSKDLKSQAAATVIGAVTQAVSIAAPSSALVTTLTSSQVNNTANAIDQTISKLSSSDESEDVELGRFADSWRPGLQLVVFGCAPFAKFDQELTDNTKCSKLQLNSGDSKVGAWTLGIRCPQISIFDGANVCTTDNSAFLASADVKTAKQAIAARVENGTVLKYGLSKDVTIADWVQKESWYTGFIAKTPATDDYGSFCSAAISGPNNIGGNGLSSFDSAMVLRAVINSMAGVAKYASNFKTDATCKTVLGSEASLIQ